MVKCPKCAATISVPETGGEQLPVAPPPAAPTPESVPPAAADAPEADAAPTPAKSKKKLYIGLGAGAAVLLLSCCCLGVGSTVAFVWLSGEKNDKVTKANFDSLHEGMTLLEIEGKLGTGTGKATKIEDVKTAFKSKQGPDLDKLVKTHEAAIAKDADYRWRNGDDFIFVIFDKSAKDNGKAVTLYWAGNSSTPPVFVEKPIK